MKIGVLKILFQVKLKRRCAFKNKNLNFNNLEKLHTAKFRPMY